MSEENKSLTIVAQREVVFYGDELLAVKATDGQIYVSVRHLCDALGLERRSQFRRIERQHILAKGCRRGAIMTPHRGRQEAVVLRVDLVPLWLAGVETNKVKEEIREKLEHYQEEVAQILWDAFREGILNSDPPFHELLKEDTPAVKAYRNALTIVELARNQVYMEARLTEHERRLGAIEARLGDPGRFIDPAQASQISQAVKAIALAVSKKTGKNEYGGVYGELYRRFEIPSYRELPASRFQEAMNWLNEWLQSAIGQTPF